MLKSINKKIVILVVFPVLFTVILASFILVWQKNKYPEEKAKELHQKTEETIQKTTIDGWEFPKEEGKHDNLAIEKWYFAGHLEEEGNPENKFGVTLFFFKKPGYAYIVVVDGIRQKIYSSQIGIGQYDLLSEEKLAIKKGDDFWLEKELFKYQINFSFFSFGDNKVELNLSSAKKPFFISNTPDAFYYQQTRVKVEGQLSLQGSEYKVKGWGWIDHRGFVKSIPDSGWRWVAIQLDNNTEMAFATSIDKKNKTNLFLFKDEQKIEIKNTEYTIEDIDYWLDPEINYKYPVKMRLKIPNLKTDLEISTLIKKYQLTQNKKTMEYKNLETSCLVKGSFTGQAVTGRAQLEIVGFIKK